MAEGPSLGRWGYRAAFLGVCALIMFLRILPFYTTPGGIPAPDFLVPLAFAWVLRRPDYAPVALVAFVMLLGDILFVRPLGLWTLLVVLACEFLRARRHVSVDLPFPVEWLMVSAVLAAITVLNGLVLAIFMVPQHGLSETLSHVFVTVAIYPVVVLFTRYVMGVRAASPSGRSVERASL